ncbi:hypothetical protein [Pseudomonas asplenii]|uniref:hypothetical protein n=1 Tax=Pseudomonas asplenii TaxID=53407 RepID=UPI00235F48F8|nr:hypothetical protein [Pseudomonas asplenii]
MARLNELLSMMQGKLITRGWDAIFSCNRVRLNHLLEQQYITRYEQFCFLPYISGQTRTGEQNDEVIQVQSLRLGPPRLSFESATSRDSTATVTMAITSGEIHTWHREAGAALQLRSRFDVTQQQGFSVTMSVDLKVVVAEVDHQGRITMDLRGATRFSCDLLGAPEAEALGAFFEQRFNELDPGQTSFQLGRINLKGYRKLTPERFRLRTQAEPGARIKGAPNEGDGVVLALIEVRGGKGLGQELGEDFPILIPSDLESGQPRYTASLVVSREVLSYAVGDDLEVPESLLFPEQNYFKVLSTHTPHDWLAVGQISPTTASVVVQPAFAAIKAGQQQRFQLLDWQGQPLTNGVTWSAVSLRSHSLEGHGRIDGSGLYTAVSPQRIGYHNLEVVVTASVGNYHASALLRVDFESLEVAPALQVQDVAQQAAIDLSVAANDGKTVTCSLLAPLHGSLQKTDQGAHWRFTANAEARGKSLSLQRVLCETDAPVQSVESLLVLNNAQSFLHVEPAFIPHLAGGANVQLRSDESVLPDVPRRWRILSGVGSIDQQGRYTAPAGGVSEATVLACEVVRHGVVLFRDIALLDRTQAEPEPTWKELSLFKIEIPAGEFDESQGRMLRNGYQQLRVRVTTKTQGVLVEGELKYFKLSLAERASMRLATNVGRNFLEIIPPDQEGIEDVPSGLEWQVRKTPSEYFAIADPRNPAQSKIADEPPVTSGEDDSLTEQYFYLLSVAAKNESTALSAGFQQDHVDTWHWSGESGGGGVGTKITVVAVDPGVFEYSFTREKRLWGITTGSVEDQMNYELNSGDFWLLTCRGQKFITLEFPPHPGAMNEINRSMIRWESERHTEIMFSYTVYYFESPMLPDENTGKTGFDDALRTIPVMGNQPLRLSIEKPSPYEPGTFGVVLGRADNVKFIMPKDSPRPLLDQDLIVALRDENGNLHQRRIYFNASQNVGTRNMLDQSKYA